MKKVLLRVLAAAIVSAAGLAPATPAAAQTAPQPPGEVTVADYTWDNGSRIDISWEPSPVDPDSFKFYRIYKAALADPEDNKEKEPEDRGPETEADLTDDDFKFLDVVASDVTEYVAKTLKPDVKYFFEVRAVAADDDGTESVGVRSTAAIPEMQIFDGGRLWLAFIVLTVCGAIVFWINRARKGKPIKVRQISGLEAIDEAVGRATEMGRPCLYVPGIQDINEIQTIASMTILSRVSKTAAEYDAKVEVPTSKSLVMTTARETVQAAFMAAGRPDAYNEDLIYYVTDEQFGYVAYLQGMMVREKPAACFYMGAFFAESLILAETGNSIGAIQVAGTAMPAQLPFFVAACDYTLIGEEFFAASAYLSGSAEELGSLKGQDVGKVIVAVLLVLGVLLATAAAIFESEALADAVTFLTDKVLKGS